MKPRAFVINKIIEQYNLQNPEYLEIGVWFGETFKFINSTKKDGIDPGQYCDSVYVNYKMTSDEFFEKHCSKKYDIIFIDGLHTAYQVSKDLFNAIQNLKPNGWIVLDDVYPHEEKEQGRLDLRKFGAQTGDVWKAVYHVLDTLVEISDVQYFDTETERGSFVFRVKPENTKNIVIDPTIPTVNHDGWYTGSDAEWNRYTFQNDFKFYIERMMKLNEKSTF
jgi:hypothetical protein